MAEGEGEEGVEGKPVEGLPPKSKIHVNLTDNATFVAATLDDMYAITSKLQADMISLENKLRTEFNNKIRVHHDRAMLRIVALEELCAVYGIRLDEHKSTLVQQAQQLDDLQNQVGVLFFRFN